MDSSQADIIRMRQWIGMCENHHGTACGSFYEKETNRALESGSFRVIDLEQMCLLDAKARIRYATLSYCWGLVQFFMLKKSNLKQLYVTGAFKSISLPRTIEQSLELAKLLGFRYFWIDSLCIIQDDREDWATVAPLMDRIYGNSVLTICAAGGNDVQYGLPGALPGSRDLIQHLEKCNGA